MSVENNIPWTDADYKKAQDELFDDIVWNGHVWDEDLTGYRLDMFTDWELIMNSRLSSADKMFEMQEVQNKYVKMYCRDEIQRDPDYYCNLYCVDDEI